MESTWSSSAERTSTTSTDNYKLGRLVPDCSISASTGARRCSRSTPAASASSTGGSPSAEEDAALTEAAELTVERLAKGPQSEDRLSASESAQDRPDPGACLGRSAEGHDRGATRSSRGAPRRSRPHGLAGGRRASRGGSAHGRPRRTAGDERRQARRDRSDRQVGLGALDLCAALEPRDSGRSRFSSPATSSESWAGFPAATRSCLSPRRAKATVVSVGAEPAGVPGGVLYIGGGPPAFRGLLGDQVERRSAARFPGSSRTPWILAVQVFDPAP